MSSFPNVIAYGVKDRNGEGYLKVSDYMKAAAVIEISILLLMATIGWGMVHTL